MSVGSSSKTSMRSLESPSTCSAPPKKLEKDSNGKLTLTTETKDGKEETLADVDQVLFATGRKPNTKDLGLESARSGAG